MNESENLPGRERTLESLMQLVAALDRRRPRRGGDAGDQAALDVSDLRDEARLRIDRLTHAAHAAVLETEPDEPLTGAPVAEPRRD